MPSDRQKAKSVGVCLGAEGHRSGERDARFLEEEDEWKNRMETEKSEELTVQAPSTDRRAPVGNLLLLLLHAARKRYMSVQTMLRDHDNLPSANHPNRFKPNS